MTTPSHDDHATVRRKNDRLADALRAARHEIATLQEQVRQLTATPNTRSGIGTGAGSRIDLTAPPSIREEPP